MQTFLLMPATLLLPGLLANPGVFHKSYQPTKFSAHCFMVIT